MAGITKIGKYLVRRELGKGAMGVVYEGFDPLIERTVAIKTILPQRLGSDQEHDVLARFKREAQAAGKLNHPGIVAVYDYGEVVVEDDLTHLLSDAGAPAKVPMVAFIAMEFVKGRELRDFFEAQERFELRDVQRLMGEMLGALAHAHANGVVHRDMKPANLIVLPDGRIKIADFGIARVDKSELTQAGTVMGTPSYMSPEQFMGQPVDGRSDIFSCGVILYQFLTGEKPFSGSATTIMYKVLREEPLAPSMLNVSLPAEMDAVVKKAIAKNPDERYQSAAEFAAAIERVVTAATAARSLTPKQTADADATIVKTVVMAPRIDPAEPATTRRLDAPLQPAVAPSPSKPARRSKSMAAVLVGVAVIAAVSAYLVLGGAGRDGDQQFSSRTGPEPGSALAPAKVAESSPPGEEQALLPGHVIVSALGLVDPSDPRFNGDMGAALAEARADAKRQLVEKVLSLHVEGGSINSNYAIIHEKLLSQSGNFIKMVLQEGAPAAGKHGLVEAQARAVVQVRSVQKSLNELSKAERIDFIRNNGDPKVAIQMTVANADSAEPLPGARSKLAENVVKERIKSFGFRVWANEGDTTSSQAAGNADFLIQGEARVKQLSAKLAASGLTITKTVLTSWTVSAVDKATGEEIYQNTVMPKGQSWATEDQALADIGKQMGDEFSKNFFLQHFSFGVRTTMLNITGLPDAKAAQSLLHELRGVRRVLDVQMVGDTGRFRLKLPDGNAADLVQDDVIRPLNAKLGQNCLTMGSSSESEVNVSFASACAETGVRAKFETIPPAGLLLAPDSRGKPLLKASPVKTMV